MQENMLILCISIYIGKVVLYGALLLNLANYWLLAQSGFRKMQIQDYFVVSTCAETHILYYIYSHEFGAPSSPV